MKQLILPADNEGARPEPGQWNEDLEPAINDAMRKPFKLWLNR
jgi:hypothetical protein